MAKEQIKEGRGEKLTDKFTTNDEDELTLGSALWELLGFILELLLK
jgi:hypothetical protein